MDIAKFTHGELSECKMCNQEAEGVTHFMLKCKLLAPIRIPYLADLHQIILNNTNISFHEQVIITKMQIIMNSTKVGADNIWTQKKNRNLAIENRIESILRRLCFALHSTRYRTLSIHKGTY